MKALADRLTDGGYQCHACGHQCRIPEGGVGRCRMRTVRHGQLLFPHERISSLAVDPMEKKPLYHVRPGEDVLSFGGLGCNFHCAFCQNWEISQVNRDLEATARDQACTAEQLVTLAIHHGCVGIAATYNEPLIATEWVGEVLELGKAKGLIGCLVSNGFASDAGLERLIPVTDAANIDLKCFTESGYRQLGGQLERVKETIRELHRRGVWVELTTLVVPGFNDSVQELAELADFIASVSADIPWHISAWHEDYQWHPGPARTAPKLLNEACDCGARSGLHYVYTGNVRQGEAKEDTLCPKCGTTLIRRDGFWVREIRIEDGRCPQCGRIIPGRW